MRISDWSSDVCSSDLRYGIEVKFENMGASDTNERLRTEARSGQTPSYDSVALGAYFLEQLSQEGLLQKFRQIGRASCRARVCQYVSISVVAVSLKKKK